MRIPFAGLFATLALAAATLVTALPAAAQPKAPVYRYCLMDGSGRDTAGMVLCRFQTLAQCLASRNSFGDTCYINPEYRGRS